ncbi:ER membrane protein complex subunit 7 homolog [Anthonomus grandis grandis]|uniref:ER membrane protein complex subunit 7 homolog n=1 Tax=Anthonomus grandis grandis TaxID=2921223 RepID=UPI00216628A3|nr:ER membrane protein complex subunit 7 homolog [Anthonomus grandis grandis]
MLICSKSIWALFALFFVIKAETSLEEDNGTGRYVIEGRVFPLSDYQTENANWQTVTRVHVNGGEFIGFVKRDGSFVVHNVPSGSYIVEVLNPEYTFEPVRVEINSKGKFRARKVNHIQTSLVVQVPYPLKIKALGKTRYFQVREQWRVTDFLFNPMVMMMLFPVLLIMVLPKLMNDPETKKDLEEIQKLTKFEGLQVGDKVSNFLAGNMPQSTTKEVKDKDKKAQKARRRPVTKE